MDEVKISRKQAADLLNVSKSTVAIGTELEPREKEEAKKRSGKRTDIEPAEKFSTGRALDKVASAVGMSQVILS